jgi:hypothetical protein
VNRHRASLALALIEAATGTAAQPLPEKPQTSTDPKPGKFEKPHPKTDRFTGLLNEVASAVRPKPKLTCRALMSGETASCFAT